MEEHSDSTYARGETLHSACLCCEHAAGRIHDLRQSLIGAVEAARAGRLPQEGWIEAVERLLARHDPSLNEEPNAAPKYHGGHIWSEVRSGLAQHRKRLIAAFDAKAYEAESVLLDGIARKIAAKVEPMVSVYADDLRRSAHGDSCLCPECFKKDGL